MSFHTQSIQDQPVLVHRGMQVTELSLWGISGIGIVCMCNLLGLKVNTIFDG